MVRTRQKQFLLWLSHAEAHKLQTLAADDGVPASEWLRANINKVYEIRYGTEEKGTKKARDSRA